MYNFATAQFFGVLGIIFSVLSMQMKTKKNIMIFLLLLNAVSALNFFFLNSISGCLICMFAVLEIFINYLYDSKNEKVPIYIIIIYVIVNILLGLLSYKSLLDILPIVCALLFCVTICTKKESTIRELTFCSQTMWLGYDLVVKAYMFSICNVLTLISIMISYYRFDYKKEKKELSCT